MIGIDFSDGSEKAGGGISPEKIANIIEKKMELDQVLESIKDLEKNDLVLDVNIDS